MEDGSQAVLPADLLARAVVAARVGDGNLVDPASQLGQLHGDLGLKPEARRLKLDLPEDLAPDDLVAGLHIGQVEVGENVG